MTAPAQPGTAVATREPSRSRELVASYASDFAAVVPSHVRVDQWVRLAQGALKKGKKVIDPNGTGPIAQRRRLTELEIAAENNPGKFLASLLDAARLGLEPGTEQYYLTPRKEKGRLEILGIIGYQGFIELMYRAGAVDSVIVEVVYQGDGFQYRRGLDTRPIHDTDWDAEERGPLRLAYAYAVMKGGATSKVVVLTKADIAKIKARSASAKSENSPWQTDEAAMWLKSAARQLAKWVPTSAEYRREVGRVDRGVEREQLAEQMARGAGPVIDIPAIESNDFLDPEGLDGDDIVDAELDETRDEPPVSKAVQAAIGRDVRLAGITSDTDRHAVVSRMAGLRKAVASTDKLTAPEGKAVAVLLADWRAKGVLAEQVAAVLAAARQGDPVPAELPAAGTRAWHHARHPVLTDGQVVTADKVETGECGICEQADEGEDGP